MRYPLFIFTICTLTISCEAQTDLLSSEYKILEEIYLPRELKESSGIISLDSLVLSFNDSGNKPIIYGLNPKSGEIKYEWLLINVENNDWEDIAHDDNYIYIGDFGNNSGKRKDLAIYKIDKRLMFSNNENVNAEIINFSFEDQTEFPTTFYQHSFDCEALINWGDSLFIFSKDWKDLKTTSYILPKNPGTYVAKKKQVFDVNGLVTGADFNKQENMLVFSGYLNFQPIIWVFKNFEENNFFSGSCKRIDMPQLSGVQNEGICFLKDGTILMSSEKKNMPARLFKIEINNF